VISNKAIIRSAVMALPLVAASIALAQSTAASTQTVKPWEQIAVPRLHEFHPAQARRIELTNGIVLMLQADHELPFVSGWVMIPGGNRDEDAAKLGLTDLYGEAWRTSGTAAHSGDALDDLLESKAASIETGAGESSTTLSWNSLKSDGDQVYALAMELLFHPAFKQEKLDLARQAVAAGIMRRNDEASEIVGRESAKLVYGATSPYGRQAELATVGAVTLADLDAWHKRTIGGKLIVAVYGDFDPAAMEAKLRASFESLPKAGAAPVRKETFAPTKPGLWFVNKEDVNQSTIALVALGTDRHNPDLPAIAVMNELLGGGFGSRLFQKIRTEKGLAYSVGGGLGFNYDHPGVFEVSSMTRSAATVETTRAILDELAGVSTNPFTEADLKRAKENILTSFLFRYDTPLKVLSEQLTLEYYGYPADFLEKYQAGIEQVTLDQVNAAAKKYVHPEKLAILVVGNKAEIEPGLDALKLGPVQIIDVTIPTPAAEKEK